MNKKPLFLIVAQSGTGKTTLANMLEEQCGLKQLESYATRAPRYEGETGHTFITEEEFANLKDIIVYTVYNQHDYGATAEQIDKSDVYIIDVPGIKTLLANYKTDRKIVIFYLSADIKTKIQRMRDRGDSDTKILDRIYNDNMFSWLEELEAVVSGYEHAKIIFINGNQSKDDVFDEVLSCINVYNKG
jgi:guanylate kinase